MLSLLLLPLFAVSGSALAPARAQAQEQAQSPAPVRPRPRPRPRADIESIVSGCAWQRADRAGTVRAVITTNGFEHPLSRLFIEWVAAPTASIDAPSVVASLDFPELNASGRKIRIVSLDPARSPCRLVIDATDTHYDVPPTEQLTIVLRAPGVGVITARRVLPPPKPRVVTP